MNNISWKFSHMVSLSLIALLVVAAFVGIVGADSGLMSDGVLGQGVS